MAAYVAFKLKQLTMRIQLEFREENEFAVEIIKAFIIEGNRF